MDFLVMDAATAADLRKKTAGREHRLDPRQIAAGEYAGKCVLPMEVLDDPAHADMGLDALETVSIEPEKAWPPGKDL